jgi:hypothetical protein
MSNKEDFKNKCFSPNWIEIDLEDVQRSRQMKEVLNTAGEDSTLSMKEASLESKRRKDLNTLLKELEDIKQSIEKAAEKQHRLANLMCSYIGDFAQ